MDEIKNACVVSIEVDGRQAYIFETDKLQERLGASRILDNMREQAEGLARKSSGKVMIYSPVSGAIGAWAEKTNRSELLNFAWKLREWLAEHGVEHRIGYLETDKRHFTEPGNGTPVANLSEIHRQMGKRVDGLKYRKGPDARPSCAFFLPCSIYGLDYTNRWTPGQDQDEEVRRERVGFRAHNKLKSWREERGSFYRKWLIKPVSERIQQLAQKPVDRDKLQRAVTFNDLSLSLDRPGGGEDQYIAFLKADGDGLGSFIREMKWNSPKWNDGKQPWRRNADFADALRRCIEQGLADAVATVSIRDAVSAEQILDELGKLRTGETLTIELPLLPQVLGGEDIWLVCRRDVALDLAVEFSKNYETLAAANLTLQTARNVAEVGGAGAKDQLTMSVGVAFAKAGYPANAMAEAAEALLHSAKSLRKGHLDGEARDEGCIDWHWIESSITETIEEARERGWAYRDRMQELRLTSRPWTCGETKTFQEQAKAFQCIARRKREQLDEILRRGLKLSRLGWQNWWQELTDDERKIVEQVTKNLPQRVQPVTIAHPNFNPWRATKVDEQPHADKSREPESPFLYTPYLDLLVLAEMVEKGPTTQPARRDQAEAANAQS